MGGGGLCKTYKSSRHWLPALVLRCKGTPEGTAKKLEFLECQIHSRNKVIDPL